MAILMAGALLGQIPPEGQSVKELLASRDPARLAWGAELAARSGGAESVPDLIKLLHSEDERVQEQALDALIRLKAQVPTAELTALLPRFMDAAVILAIQNNQRDLLLLLLREEQPFDPWWVALNEALGEGDGGPEYWGALLREWVVHVVIYVVDPGQTPAIQPEPIQYWCGDSTAQNRTGFPARALYSLSLSASTLVQPADPVLTATPHAVYVQRRHSISGCGAPIDRDVYRGDFVASAMGQAPPDPKRMGGRMKFEVAWSSDEGYVAETAKLREKTLGGLRAIVDWMLESKRLPAEDAKLRIGIEVEIKDQRPYKPRDLPPIPPWIENDIVK